MSERISGDPDRLESYSARTLAMVGWERGSVAEYSHALGRFLEAEPNDFGDGGVVDRTAQLERLVDGFGALDAQPEAFAFALRQLDRTSAEVLSTIDAETFSTLVAQQLAEELEPDGGLSGADLATLVLDLIGIFDPTPIADGASGLLSLFRGEWAQAGLSVAAMIPYLGDAGKVLKFGKMLERFQHLAKVSGDTAKLERILKSLKHVDWKNPGKLNEALGTMNRLAGDAAKRYRDPKVLQAAQKRGLPTEGPVPFVPPKKWDAKNPPTEPFRTPGGLKWGTRDAYGNGWVWDPHKMEWDVQIESGKFGLFSPDGRHANISSEGHVTH